MGATRTAHFDNGTSTISHWETDNIQLSYADSRFEAPGSFWSRKEDELVRLHYGLKGNYHFTHQQLGKYYQSVGGQQNVLFSSGFDILIETQSAHIITFGITYPKDIFVKISEKANDQLKVFCDAVLSGKSVLLHYVGKQ